MDNLSKNLITTRDLYSKLETIMSNFVANVLKLVSGSVTAQILSILLVPLITRIYSPDDLGIFQIFLSISGILIIFSTFSYQFAIMLPKKEEDSANLAFLCAILVTHFKLFDLYSSNNFL